VVEESPGLQLTEALVRDGYSVTVYDPIAMSGARAWLADRGLVVTESTSVADLIESVEVAVLAVPAPEFEKVPLVAAGLKRRGPVVIDPWRLLRGVDPPDRLEIVHLGVG
jgi:UDPglucose 6-dehydrogenase